MERNRPFLSYVATDLLKKYGHNLSCICVVFPNKRASLFLDNELMEQVSSPIWSPRYTTIRELFCSQSKRVVADPIKSVCDLYKCFLECTGMEESLDQFYAWGQLLLADFDDVDKNLANPHQVFSNVRDLHAFDDVSFLTPLQRESLKRFFSSLTDSHEDSLKERFLRLWSQLSTLYDHFNAHMASQGLGYEGSIYREVVEAASLSLPYDHYIFVGFHVLSASEQKLFTMVKTEGKAHFYWDYDNYYIRNNSDENSPGYYISQQLTLFPNELEEDASIYDNYSQPKKISYVSAPSQDIQARYVETWLGSIPAPSVHPDTAIVLCDEALLPSVIHSLPSTVGSINITSGLPLRQSPIYSFIMRLIQLQTIGHPRNTDKYRLTYIKSVLLHPLTSCFSEQALQLLQELQSNRRYFPQRQELRGDEGLALLFMDIDSNAEGTTHSSSRQMLSYLIAVVQSLGKFFNKSTTSDSEPFTKETIYRMYTILSRLSALMDSGDLHVDLITLQRLIIQIVDTTSVPFHGEPAIGVQVMGVLETRNLDFKHLLILSCNEKNMPKVSSSSSFIPYAIRQAYGLTTPDHQSSIYAYYFFRMLQRTDDATLVYCNVPDNRHSGEMSRFMLQLLVDSHLTISRRSLSTEIRPLTFRPENIVKDSAVMDKLRNRFNMERYHELSPTAINRYLRCPLSFYYSYIGGLKEPESYDEDIDNMMFGSIFHKAAEYIYNQMPHGNHVTKSDVEYVLNHPEVIERCVDHAFSLEYFNMKSPTAKTPEYNGMQLLNRSVIIKYIEQLMKTDLKMVPFTIINLEEPVYDELTLFAGMPQAHRLKYGGVIDRLDEVSDETGHFIRVLDYKTGSKEQKNLPDVNAVFDPANVPSHSDYYLQTLLYSLIISHSNKNPHHLNVRPALLFIQKSNSKDYNPIIQLGNQDIKDVEELRDDYMANLLKVLEEIFNPEVAFTKTTDEKRCKDCPYRKLCY